MQKQIFMAANIVSNTSIFLSGVRFYQFPLRFPPLAEMNVDVCTNCGSQGRLTGPCLSDLPRQQRSCPLQPGSSSWLLLWALGWFSQFALASWPCREDQEEVSLRNGDDSVNDAAPNSDCGSRNPKEEKADSHSGSSQTKEQPGSSSVKAHFCVSTLALSRQYV